MHGKIWPQVPHNAEASSGFGSHIFDAQVLRFAPNLVYRADAFLLARARCGFKAARDEHVDEIETGLVEHGSP